MLDDNIIITVNGMPQTTKNISTTNQTIPQLQPTSSGIANIVNATELAKDYYFTETNSALRGMQIPISSNVDDSNMDEAVNKTIYNKLLER